MAYPLLYLQDFDGNKDQSSVEKHEMQPFRAIVLNSMEKDCSPKFMCTHAYE